MGRLVVVLAVMLGLAANAQRQPFDLDLYRGAMPNSNGIDRQPFDDSKGNYKPSVRVFLPDADKATGQAVVCCPGGCYSGLAMGNEGYNWAEFFMRQGVALVVLKYRMPHANPDVPLSDAVQALRLVRDSAELWHLDPAKVGIMGSSAGGHLAAMAATMAPAADRPNFHILFYPVITFDSRYTHLESRHNLIGKEAADNLVERYSLEKQVSDATPPAIILVTDNDELVPSENSLLYYTALHAHGVQSALHVYADGPHGFGSHKEFAFHNEMEADLAAWLKALR